MLTQIALFLLETVATLWVSLFLFRLYALLIGLNLHGGPGGIGAFVIALTDWAVLPLRRALPKIRHLDLACLIPAWGLEMAHSALRSMLLSGHFVLLNNLVGSLFELLMAMVSGLTGLLIIHAILSWVSVNPELNHFFDRLAAPLLRPVRRWVPPIAGVDLSVLVALLALQVVNIFLTHMRANLWIWL
jgi:YggT family protein